MFFFLLSFDDIHSGADDVKVALPSTIERPLDDELTQSCASFLAAEGICCTSSFLMVQGVVAAATTKAALDLAFLNDFTDEVDTVLDAGLSSALATELEQET